MNRNHTKIKITLEKINTNKNKLVKNNKKYININKIKYKYK